LAAIAAAKEREVPLVNTQRNITVPRSRQAADVGVEEVAAAFVPAHDPHGTNG
jgi:hypothetical protein